jgi:hypothetical protein
MRKDEMELPTETNITATVVDDVIVDGEKGTVDAVEALAIADVPELALPVVKPLFEGFLNWLGGIFAKVLERKSTAVVVDAQVKKEESALSLARAALVATEAAQTQDPAALAECEKEEIDAATALGHSDGSAPSQ